MKRNSVAKRLSITSLCLATAISAFSGIAALNDNVAVAEDIQTVQATDLVYTNLAADKVTRDENGLRISSDNAYTATFKDVFKGMTTFKFTFPETYDETLGFYGDFKFHIADATNDSNSFDIIYYAQSATAFRTAPYVKWGDEIRTSNKNGATMYNYLDRDITGISYAPCLLGKGNYAAGDSKGRDGGREGILSIVLQNDVLYILANDNDAQNPDSMNVISKFDGTHDATKTANGFDSKTRAWGLPAINFPNGYTVTVSSEITTVGVADKATDVLISSIETDGVTSTASGANLETAKYKRMATSIKPTYNTKYDFKTAAEFEKDSLMQAFDTNFDLLTEANAPAQAAGKVFLGWKNTDSNNLYPAYTVMQKGKYEALVIDYDTVSGASVRLSGKSGIRFQTMFDATQYEAVKGYFQSYGTLVAYTDTLTTVGKDFTIENYKSEATFAQVKNTKDVFDYTDKNSKTWKAYSMSVVDIAEANYTKAYSARGYIVINYANGITGTVYTDYNATDNSRTIAQVATALKTMDSYSAMTDAQKAIIDAYAAAQN